MLYMICCFDVPDGGAARQAAMDAHLVYVKQHIGKFESIGPLMDADGKTAVGSLFIGDFPDAAAARAHINADPFTRAGVFESVVVRGFVNRAKR